jgi:hypothetical protein
MPYVYRHIRLDKNEPFYIGIGSDENGKYLRAKKKNSRSKYWHSIVKNYGYSIDIILDDLTWEEACEKEKEFILLYGRKDLETGILCNMTDGGDGFVGGIFTDEHRKKLSIASRNISDETRKKLSESRRGRKLSEEQKKKIGLSSLGRKHPPRKEEYKKHISNVLKGRKKSPRTEQHNFNFSQATSKLVIDMSTGIYYIGVKNAASAYNINYNTLMAMLNGNKKNKTNLIYI